MINSFQNGLCLCLPRCMRIWLLRDGLTAATRLLERLRLHVGRGGGLEELPKIAAAEFGLEEPAEGKAAQPEGPLGQFVLEASTMLAGGDGDGDDARTAFLPRTCSTPFRRRGRQEEEEDDEDVCGQARAGAQWRRGGDGSDENMEEEVYGRGRVRLLPPAAFLLREDGE